MSRDILSSCEVSLVGGVYRESPLKDLSRRLDCLYKLNFNLLKFF